MFSQYCEIHVILKGLYCYLSFPILYPLPSLSSSTPLNLSYSINLISPIISLVFFLYSLDILPWSLSSSLAYMSTPILTPTSKDSKIYFTYERECMEFPDVGSSFKINISSSIHLSATFFISFFIFQLYKVPFYIRTIFSLSIFQAIDIWTIL